jgi:hypothetical protein
MHKALWVLTSFQHPTIVKVITLDINVADLSRLHFKVNGSRLLLPALITRVCAAHLRSNIRTAAKVRSNMPRRGTYTFHDAVSYYGRHISSVMWRIVTGTPIVRRRDVKHFPAEANARNSRTSVAR